MELFKDIEYKGVVYTISNQGRIFKDGKQLINRLNADGYYVVTTKNYNQQYRSTGVHRLVALAFCDGYSSTKNEVNHKDYNRTNNCSENLEWVTHADNVRYSNKNHARLYGKENPNYGNRKLSQYYRENPEISKTKQGRPGVQNGRSRSIQMYKNNCLVKEFPCIVDCCKYLIDNNYTNASQIASVRGRIDSCIRKDKLYLGFAFIKK